MRNITAVFRIVIYRIIRISLSVLLVSAFLFSCRKEDEFTNDPSAMLSFSTDTIYFDTVFVQGTTKPASVTKQLWVKNTNSKGVRVNISLKGNSYGLFVLNIDGQPTNGVRGKEIRGKDSIMIFVQMYIKQDDPSAQNIPFVVTDQLLFETNGNMQDVDIVGWARSARYLKNQVLDCASSSLHWTKDTPYVIYDSILVPKGCTLTIDAGTHIYSHAGSCFLVAGTLIVNGTPDNPVIFEGDRMEPDYISVPGQWIGIRLLPSSSDNVINSALIKNGLVGVEVDSSSLNSNPKLSLKQSVVQNMTAIGIAGFTGDILAVNNLVTNCGQYTFYGVLGGNYDLYYNTFAMYSTSFNRTTPTLVLDNSPYKNGNTIIAAFPLNADLKNNIIYGSQEDEIVLNNAEGGNTTGTVTIQNCLIKTKEYKTSLDINNNIINSDPQFKDTGKNDFDLSASSPAKGTAVPISGISVDLINRSRSSSTPSIGCYE